MSEKYIAYVGSYTHESSNASHSFVEYFICYFADSSVMFK